MEADKSIESYSFNPECKICTVLCSEKMGFLGDICYWHQQRMGEGKIRLHCGCNLWDVASGDLTAQQIIRVYYDDWNMPVFNLFGMLHCCGNSQSKDDAVYRCGVMNVCERCKIKHDKSILERNLKNYDFIGPSDDF